MGLKKGDVKRCGKTDLFVFFRELYFPVPREKTWFTRRAICCLRVKFVFDLGVWGAQLRYYSSYKRNVVV